MATPKLISGKANISAVADFISAFYHFRISIKLHHWNIEGKASYARHMAIDEAIDSIDDVIDRLAETSVCEYGALNFRVPVATDPDDINAFIKAFIAKVDAAYDVFTISYQKSILDDCREACTQLLYRTTRLS